MKNCEVYQKDPAALQLVNKGVASVNYDNTKQALAVLRSELETFVCDGQYAKGLSHILETYLKNIDQAQQPGVWVSGFFGSGKSHLVKMLHALWEDTEFEDRATARGIANLPQDIDDNLSELSIQAKRNGGLFAASGTLGSSAKGSVRLALLSIIFKSAGLPEKLPFARFVMWLKKEGIYDQIHDHVIQNGFDWDEEIDNLYVAEGLHEALIKFKPNLFSSSASCADTLINLYPDVIDVSSDEMTKAFYKVLTKEGKFPLTLVILDEVQQYIGEDGQRSMEVQEAVEACCKKIGGKLLFVGTGQTAVTGTSNLKKLEGRFTLRVELSDADVDAVIRQVILAKKPEAKIPIENVMQTNMGEISRHLSGTTICHRQSDIPHFSKDYPILPVRRRFWENTLRALDQTGTDSQLRNQLSMVHKVIQSNLSKSLGHIIPADHLYFDCADKLLQSRILPRNIHEKTMSWIRGSENEQLTARAVGLVFLINIISDQNNELGIHATVDTLADLMIDDLHLGSSSLRNKLPNLLNGCELLMKVGDEFRIQTEESSAWNDDYQSQRSALSNEVHRLEIERNDRIRRTIDEKLRKLSLFQGNSKVLRKICLEYDLKLSTDAERSICVWVRDGWRSDENSVRADSRQSDNKSPIVYVFIPKHSPDALRSCLIDFKAASATLDKRGSPNEQGGLHARAAMETTMLTAEAKINEILEEAFSEACVFQGGGDEIGGNNLQEIVHKASVNAMQRLYPKFHIADDDGWSKVYEAAQKNAPDALRAVSDQGEPVNNPVCKEIVGYIAGGKSGADIRNHFESPPYGWSRDAVDGGLRVLLVAGSIQAQDDHGKAPSLSEMDRKAIGKVTFKIESITVSTMQRIKIRKLLQKVGLTATPGKEHNHILDFLQKMQNLAENAGGDPPKPARPDISSLKEIKLMTGNEQLIAIYNRRDELADNIDKWTEVGNRIVICWLNWTILKRLLDHADSLQDIDIIQANVNTIEQECQLLDDPDPVRPLIANLVQLLRDELNNLDNKYDKLNYNGMKCLEADVNWKQLLPEQQNHLLSEHRLRSSCRPSVKLKTTNDVLNTLDSCSLSMFADRVAALLSRFDQVAVSAAEFCEPNIQFVTASRRTLKTDNEIDVWGEEVKSQLKAALVQGPVSIR